MSEPFVGEIRMFAGNFAPRGWAFCDGQLLAISQNDALFSLLGTIYGGDGVSGGGGASPRMELSTPDHQVSAILAQFCAILRNYSDALFSCARPQHPQMIARRKPGVYAPTAPTSIVFA